MKLTLDIQLTEAGKRYCQLARIPEEHVLRMTTDNILREAFMDNQTLFVSNTTYVGAIASIALNPYSGLVDEPWAGAMDAARQPLPGETVREFVQRGGSFAGSMKEETEVPEHMTVQHYRGEQENLT